MINATALAISLAILLVAVTIKAIQLKIKLKDEIEYTLNLLNDYQMTNAELLALRKEVGLVTSDLKIAKVEVENLKLQHKEEVKAARADSVRKQRAVMRGQATEHLAPFLQTDLNPKDFRFIGDPIDYLIIDSGSDITDRVSDEVNRVILMDVKTGSATLSRLQRRIRDAVVENRVSFSVYNPDKNTTRIWDNENKRGRFLSSSEESSEE